MNSLNQVDELVKEYLLFRGFTNTYRAFENECRVDKDKSYQVDKILDELLGYISNSDIQRLIDYYRYLDLRFFSRLDSRFQRTVKKFELCLLRHYLVYAIQHKKRDKVIEFFDLYGPDLHGKPEWSQWFALPYVKNPATDPTFETFFSKQWTDNYMISLHNFLATTFQFMPLPSLLSFNMDRVQRKVQQTEIESLKSTIENMKAAAEARENEVAKLKHEVAETRREMTDGITLIRRRAASMTNELKAGNGATKSKSASTDKATSTITTMMAGGGSSMDKAAATLSVNQGSSPSDPNGSAGSDVIIVDDEEPFVVVSEEEYSEHASAITHAKFSSEGNLIASCDMDNIVRIWSHKGQSFNPVKINNNSSNILSLEWEARSDRFLFLGTDVGTIRVYNVENKSIVQEFNMDSKYPWVTHLSCSPVEPIFVCAGTGSKLSAENKNRPGALVAWSMKSMTDIGTFRFDSAEEDTGADINTITLNHNGQMLVSGDHNGLVRIFDVRSMKSIMEWKDPSNRPCCVAQFSFDENSIYTVDYSGQLSQWSIHKRGASLSQTQLAGFPPPAAFPSPGGSDSIDLTSSHSTSTKKPSAGGTNTAAATLPPRPKSNPSTSSRSRLSISSSRSTRLPRIAVDDSVTQSLLSVSPRPQMVAFSADTDFCLCASSSLLDLSRGVIASSSSSVSSLSSMMSENNGNNSNSNTTTQGTIYRVADGRPSLQFGYQPIYQKLTTVDWTSSSNTCLLGSVDGSVKVTNLIKV
ncbi:WD40-repeat-containing domain protein [Zychaea mexicana]|uniref:WD40-repeat-containing domain protein n=1 Tax=Zychaea mexicana TaxID=64656 RepID=UPI0022FF132B|nr:WD40-repeat-containing domain protein [Zychaea mexicana]KAI9499031.1 WD40-repeat-containing domain protein [Zychaea mexicana]